MKGKWILLLALLLLGVAFFTRPDDKTCIIGGVKAVWGQWMPDKEAPAFFEEFMDRSSENVTVKDRFLYKVIKYRVKEKETAVAIGAFGEVFAIVEPYQSDVYIPSMPAARK